MDKQTNIKLYSPIDPSSKCKKEFQIHLQTCKKVYNSTKNEYDSCITFANMFYKQCLEYNKKKLNVTS